MAVRNLKDEAELKIQNLTNELAEAKARIKEAAVENNRLRTQVKNRDTTIKRINKVNEELNLRLREVVLQDKYRIPVVVKKKTINSMKW